MKTLYENIDYDIELNVIDEDPSSCTFSVSCSRMDLVSIIQDLVELTKFVISVNPLADSRTLVMMNYTVIDNEGNSNTSQEYIMLFKGITNDDRYYIKTEFDNRYVLKTLYDDIDVLNKLKNVDGIGSGLDGDLLDGISASQSANPNSIPASDVNSKLNINRIFYYPTINSVKYNNDIHIKNGTYIITIDAVDPKGLNLTYELECDDPTVVIVQDIIPHIWTVTYPNYGVDTTVLYSVRVTNTDGDIDTLVVNKTVINAQVVLPPIIISIVWNNDNHEENMSYVMTINATDPQGQDLTYDVACDDPTVVIVQSGTPNIWNITYGDYEESTVITYTITATNEDLLFATGNDIKTVGLTLMNPIVDSLTWSDDYHEENNSYSLTIIAHDPQFQDLTYNVVCSNPTVGVVQSGTPYIWNVIYGEYTEDTDVLYTITVTNEDLLTDIEYYYMTIHNFLLLGDRGIFGGGIDASAISVIDYVTITTPGDATDFGDLTIPIRSLSACSNGNNDRGVFGGGCDGSSTGFLDFIEYITIPTIGNTINFGNLNLVRRNLAACSNGVNDRGIFGGGIGVGFVDKDEIEYITISTIGNAIDFGDLSIGISVLTGTSNGVNDRGIFGGGKATMITNIIEYVTISTTGDATDFGDLSYSRRGLAATSNVINNRGVFAGGWNNNNTDIIDYVTISTLGNAINFGDLSVDTNSPAATSNGIGNRGIFGGGYDGNTINRIEYVTISTPGDATDFGDLTINRYGLAATSND